jgi:dTDP-4-dehydrorhamnose reductase
MNILIIGSSGLLGKKIYETIKQVKKLNVFHNGLNKRKYNLEKVNNLKKLILISKPELIINALGFTNIDLCEKNKKSYLINVEIVKNIFLIKSKFKLEFKFIHFSTDQIYDSKNKKLNSENSKIVINNKYSKQKLDSEKICLKNNALIFRTNFFGKTKSMSSSFTNWIFKKFKQKKKFYLFNDIFFNPLRTGTISKIILEIILKNKINIYGLYNLSSKGFINKSNFAIKFAKKTKIYKKNYTIINSNKILNIKRSKNMMMNNKKFIKDFQISLPRINDEIINESKNYL